MKSPSIYPLTDSFHIVENANLELLNVSNCAKVLRCPGSKPFIIISTVGQLSKRFFTGSGTNGGYESEFIDIPTLHHVSFDFSQVIIDGGGFPPPE